MTRISVNHRLFRRDNFDSGSMSRLCSVIRVFGEAGEYRGTVLRAGKEVGAFFLVVDEESPERRVAIDLSSFERRRSGVSGRNRSTDSRVAAGGLVHLWVSGGRGDLAAVVELLAGGGASTVLDTRKLGKDDLFSVGLLRPGSYLVRNRAGRARTQLKVGYPVPTAEPLRLAEPLVVTTGSTRFSPDPIELVAGQRVVFHCTTTARITIDLEKPDDGPSGIGARRPPPSG